MATLEMCTLEQVKTYLGILDNSNDAQISQLITFVTAEMLAALNRLDLMPQADYVDLRRSPVTACKLYLAHYPIAEVSEVQIGGVVVPEWNEDDPLVSGWRFEGDPNPENMQFVEFVGLVNGECCCCSWVAAWHYCAPACAAPDISITYKAGYNTPPAALTQAAIELVAYKRSMGQILGGNPNLASRQMGDYTETFGGSRALIGAIVDTASTDYPGSIQAVLEQYRRITV